ncbi:hypothetical protein ABEL47_01635 [Escherichia coli]
MGLFGGSSGTSTKTTVKPAPQVTEELKRIVGDLQNTDFGDFIARQYAGLTDDQKDAINGIAQSGQLNKASQFLSPQFAKGMQQVADNNKYLQSEANAPVTVDQVLSDRNAALNSTVNKNALSQATTAPSKTLQGSAGARVAMRRNSGFLTAQNAFQRGAEGANSSINQRLQNQSNRVNDLNAMNNIANANVGYGIQGAQLNNQALQNKLQAGNILQQNQQALNDQAYQNANGAALFPYQQLQNKANIMSQVSNMAGYTQYGTQSGESKGQKLLGQGIALVGSYGKMGGFSSNNPFASQTTKNAWNSYASNGGAAGVAGPMPDSSNASDASNSSGGMSPFWQQANQRMGYGSYYGGY